MNSLRPGEFALVDPMTVSIPERIYLSDMSARRAAVIDRDVQKQARILAGTVPCGPPKMRCARASLVYVASFEKQRDPVGFDMLAGPLYTLRVRRGDCLTLCTLLLSFVLVQGYRGHLQRMCLPGNEDHIVVNVWDGRQYAALDPTAEFPEINSVSSLARTGVPCPIWGLDG